METNEIHWIRNLSILCGSVRAYPFFVRSNRLRVIRIVLMLNSATSKLYLDTNLCFLKRGDSTHEYKEWLLLRHSKSGWLNLEHHCRRALDSAMTPAGASAMLPVYEDREGKPRTAQLSQRLIKTGGALGSLLQASTKKAATSLKVSEESGPPFHA